MYDDEVLKGTALLLLKAPEELLQSSKVLMEKFGRQFGSAVSEQILDALVQPPAVRAREDCKEVAGIRFTSPAALQMVLKGTALNSVAHVGDYELRRGDLQVGPYEVHVEVVVKIEGDAADVHPQPSPHESSAPTKPVMEPHHAIEPHHTLPLSDPTEATVVRSAAPPSLDSALPVVMNFILLYCSMESGVSVSQVSKRFTMSPYIVTQILREYVSPLTVVMLPTKHNPQKNCDNYRALITIDKDDVNNLYDNFDGIVVELMGTKVRKGMVAREETVSEARFRIFINNGDSFRGVTERRRITPGEGEVYDPTPKPLQLKGFTFDREWLEDPLAVRTTPPAESSRSSSSAPPHKKTREEQNSSHSAASSVQASSDRDRAKVSYPSPTVAVNEPVQSGTLPPGWTAIFSHEYQQVYYAFKCPQTGRETTSWTRPAF